MKKNLYKLKQDFLKSAIDFLDKNEPVLKGCPNKKCFCTGECKEVVGYRPKLNNHELEVNL